MSGVVGRDESWPASLKTRSNMEEDRFVDCGELGPEDICMDWYDWPDCTDQRWLEAEMSGRLAAVCERMAAVLDGVPGEK